MTCDEAEILLQALIDGELDAGHAREVEAHVATCPKCTALLRRKPRRAGAPRCAVSPWAPRCRQSPQPVLSR